MPLEIVVERDGQPVDFLWDGVMLSIIYTVAHKEGDPDAEYQGGKSFGALEGNGFVDFSLTPIYYLATKAPLVRDGVQTLEHDHRFELGERVVDLKAGDVLRAWRSHKS